jgi:glycosyltransferase involved in cell wall biosynthesis
MSLNQSPASLHVTLLSRVRLNPYVNLLAAGVEDADSAIHTSLSYTLPWRRLLLKRRFDILHLHWVELQYSYGNAPIGQAKRSLQNLLLKLRYLQQRGTRLVYTVHNLSQHEGLHPQLNLQANRWLFRHADAIHVHDRTSAEAVAQIYNRHENIFIIPHGNYIGVYPNQVNRDEARTRLGIPPEPFVYLFMGQLRPYKGLDRLIQAFIKLNDSGTILIIAGQVSNTDYVQSIRTQIDGRANIKLFPDFVPNEDLQYFFNSADVCVLPYRHATTSGAALLDYSFAKPIIAPAIGPFPDLVTSDRGVLFDADSDLTEALRQAQEIDIDRAISATLAFAESRNWSTIGAKHAAMYRSFT